MPDHSRTVAVITGGAQGLGLSIAERLVAEGCRKLVISGRNGGRIARKRGGCAVPACGHEGCG